MNKVCVIALALADGEIIPFHSNWDYIGADRGAVILADHKIRMRFAAGDFDSIRNGELELIENYSDEVIHLNPVKNDSDSEHVIREAISRGYEKIYVYGAFGGRKDHEYVNVRLCEMFAGKVVLIDRKNQMEAINPGTYFVNGKLYKYISIFTDERAVVSLKNMKYPLDHMTLYRNDLYGLSNEINGEQGTLVVHEGKVILIQSND